MVLREVLKLPSPRGSRVGPLQKFVAKLVFFKEICGDRGLTCQRNTPERPVLTLQQSHLARVVHMRAFVAIWQLSRPSVPLAATCGSSSPFFTHMRARTSAFARPSSPLRHEQWRGRTLSRRPSSIFRLQRKFWLAPRILRRSPQRRPSF